MMQKFLTEFERHCKIPGVDSNKANAYAKAIKYLCDFLGISVIDTTSVSKIKSVEKDIYDKHSPLYNELLSSLEQQRRKSYLENGFIRASLKLFFDFAQQYCSTEQSISDKIKAVIQAYKADFATRDKEERYKWKAVGTYKKHWDLGSSDFLHMLKSAFGDTDNLLRSGNYYPYRMLEVFSEAQPETVRSLFKMLYDEMLPFEERYTKFREGFTSYFKPQNLLHYQDLHAISVYLSFEHPEKYYIYKYTVVKNFIKQIGFSCKNIDSMTDAEKMELTLDLFNTVLEVVLQDEELKQMSHNRLDDTCYSDDAYHMLAHDVIYFGSRLKDEYWPSPEEYDPHLTKEDWTQYILNIEKPSHPRPMQMLKALMELGGEATCKQLSEVYGGTVSGYVGCTVNLGKRAKKTFSA